MPIYEYACAKCEREFEVEQRITEDPVKTCPHCRSRRVKRLISSTSFVLKGSGWYSDLYSSKKSEGGDGKEVEKGEKGEDAKPEKKGDGDSGSGTDSSPSDKNGKGKGKAKGKKKAAKKSSKKDAA